MRRLLAAAAVFALLVFLACPAFAATGASDLQAFAAVSADGSCQVTVNIQLHLEEVVEDLSFPLPGNAQDVTVNGSPARTSRTGGVLQVDLSKVVGSVIGDFTVSVSYRLSGLVAVNEEGIPELTVPLLSGFAYPVERLSFSVSLPGAIENRPVFTSGYFQQDIEPLMSWVVNNNTVTGSVGIQLRNEETFSVMIPVSEEMFPNAAKGQWFRQLDEIGLWVLTAAAVVYWVVFLRCWPLVRERSAAVPEGFTAGQLGSVLTGCGTDLTLTVFTWAQLGYILIHREEHGRVTLHKRMDMGNERSSFEQKLFKRLFGNRRAVDGGSYHYADFCRLAAGTPGNARSLYSKRSGSIRVFRSLCAGIGLFAGISLGSALSENAVLSALFVIIFAAACAAAAWAIHDWVKCLHLNGKRELYLALGCAALWLLMGILAGQFALTAAVVAGQFAAGLFAAYGGRRTAPGRQMACQVLGLRKFLRSASPEQVHRLTDLDGDYFFTMFPAAMALGCGERFAAHFGKRRLGGCPYLTTGMDGHRTAAEWAKLLQQVADALDERQKRLGLERLLSK